MYDVEAQLIELAGGLLSEELAAGGGAIVLATAAHLKALEDWVRLCGPGVQGAAAAGRYHPVPIERVLETDGGGDPAAAVEARLLEMLDQIPSEIAPVLIIGEASAALWERGEVTAALHLEELSNALCASRPVSLVCAYPERVLEATADVEQACRQHGGVLDAPPFPRLRPEAAGTVISSAVLPPAPAACRTARHLLRAALAPAGGTKLLNSAELVVGELAANAVRHAGSTFLSEVSLSNGIVRLAVTDAAPLPDGWSGFPIARDHGLGVVAALASSWSVEPLAGGKVVWADLQREER